MGTAALLLAQVGFSFLSSMQEQSAIKDQANAAQNELTRQQKEANLQAAEEKSERARAADKQFASAIVAMEAIGGAGSQNEQQALGEIAGNAGLDLARIEGNRRRQVSALQAEKRSVRDKAKGAIKQSQAKFLSSALQAGGDYYTYNQQLKTFGAAEDEALNLSDRPSVSRRNTKSGLLGGGV